EGAPLQAKYRHGFSYSDCWTDDARLVTLNAVDARERGASIRTRTAVTSARREAGLWRIESADGRTVYARALVNAAGPWVNTALALTGLNAPHGVRLVQGSHIVV
ncbi:FAD-dependent oxidoreductase, partial [Mycobacterium tuberculosis]